VPSPNPAGSSAWAVGNFAPDTARTQEKAFALHCR
jgi:hypothetical protein